MGRKLNHKFCGGARKKEPADGSFVTLGNFRFEGEAFVSVDTWGTDGYVVIDAVEFIPGK